MKIGRGTCNGTFGELLQGVLDERPFLVTFPIEALKTEATFIPSPASLHVEGPSSKVKAIEACNKLLNLFDIKCGGTLMINSNISPGKGMASSSADIVAAISAVADSFDLKITEEIISTIASSIEPTDAVMYKGSVAYDYINGELIENLGKIPSFYLIGIDLGGVVDTVAFNKITKQYDETDRNMFLDAYELVKMGIKNKDLSPIIKASTISAAINQKFLPKPFFSELERIASSYGGGTIVAHSGTVMGIMLDPKCKYNSDSEISREISRIVENDHNKLFYYLHEEINI
ncbi:GHMP family kinase ATP-binding protein [Neobacillus sp. LXY-4]|uniref:GHMP family kinase ATP-binding protein n=1 Tax=Neobacillus sp. LXY-4 TaxID=3379826 RepID=UPI003EE0FE2A